MKKHDSHRTHSVSQKVITWVLTFVMLLGLIPYGAIQVTEAAEVHSTGYTYGVDKATFDARIDKLLGTVFLGEYPTSHVQGIAVDDELKYVYASFTTKLAKVDLETGEIVGVVHNWSGHLGDMAYYDGRVYGSLEYKGQNSFYVAVFDCDKIVGDVDHTECMRTMYLPEVSRDYGGSVDGVRYVYGCSGIDGVAFGPIPGDDSGEIVMMVAYGIFTDSSSNVNDRDYQVILQYDLSSFLESDGNGGTKLKEDMSDILDQSHYHKEGPEHEDKYFIYTGNTNYGVQNLEYDSYSDNYIMAVYNGSCPEYPNYSVFYVDTDTVPQVEELIMAPDRLAAYKALPNSNPGCTNMAQGKILHLTDNNGSSDGSATLSYQDCVGPDGGTERIWGTMTEGASGSDMSTGVDHLYGDYFYVRGSTSALISGNQTGTVTLLKCDRDTDTYTKVGRTLEAPAAKKILSYSMDNADLYTEDGVTYLKNGVDNSKYAAVVEGTSASVGVDGTANKALAFNAWNYPAEPDQVYLDDATVAYMNQQIAAASYGYSYSFWAKVKTSNDGHFVPFVGMYREDGTYLGAYELRGNSNTLKYVVNGVGTATVGAPGDGGAYIYDNASKFTHAANWNFYTVTEFNGSIKLYENGVLLKTITSINPRHHMVEPAADFIIGGGAAKLWLDQNNRGRLIGSVDDVTIYSGVLTADQIAAEYAKVTTKETSGVATVTKADDTVEIDDTIVYLNYDLTADKDQDLVYDYGVNVESLTLPNLTKDTDYTVSGTKLTLKASWLGAQECGKIEKTAGGITTVLTITNAKNPVLNYTFDSTSLTGNVVKDSSDYGVDAIASNISSFGEDHMGLTNGSFEFNGFDYNDPTYVRLSDQDAAWLNSVLDEGFTINFWAKPTDENGCLMAYAGLYDSTARPLGVVESNDLANQVSLDSAGASDNVISLQGIAAKKNDGQNYQAAFKASATEVGLWALYTLTYDKASNTMKLYLDGELAGSVTVADDILGEIDALFIGHTYKKYFSNTAYTRGGFVGLMDDFQVYNYALSDSEIHTLAAGGAIKPAIKTEPVIHWTMDASSLNGDGTMTESSSGLLSYFQNVTPVAGVDGTEGGALYFDGSADADEFSRVWLSDEGIAKLNTEIGNKITMTFWVKTDAASQGEGYPYTGTWTPVGGIFGESDHRFLAVPEFRYNKLCACIQAGSDKNTAGVELKKDKWYFVVMTYDGTKTEQVTYNSTTSTSTLHDYYVVDPAGGSVAALTGDRPFTNTDLYKAITHLEFGGQYAKGHWQDTNVRGRFIGALDDIKIYNISVTAEDVAKLVKAKPVTGMELTLSDYELETTVTSGKDVELEVTGATALQSITGLDSANWTYANGKVTVKFDALTVGSNALEMKFDTGTKIVAVNVIDDSNPFTADSFVFDKTDPANVTVELKTEYGAPASAAATGLTADDYKVSGQKVTLKLSWLMKQQPGAVELTVTKADSTTEKAVIYVVNSAPTETDPAGGLAFPVLYYGMDKADMTTATAANGIVTGTIADISGNGLDLVTTGLTTVGANKVDTADDSIKFDSYRDHNISYAALDSAGNTALKSVLGDEVTFSFWHMSDRISSNYMPVMGLYAEDDRPLLLAEFRDSGSERRGAGETTKPTLTATPKDSLDYKAGVLSAANTVTMNSTWHHYVMTYNNTTGAAAVYVDGALAASGTLATGQLDDFATFEIGALANADYYNVGTSGSRESGMAVNSHGRLHGYLDEVKVFTAALSADDVSKLYTAGVESTLPTDKTALVLGVTNEDGIALVEDGVDIISAYVENPDGAVEGAQVVMNAGVLTVTLPEDALAASGVAVQVTDGDRQPVADLSVTVKDGENGNVTGKKTDAAGEVVYLIAAEKLLASATGVDKVYDGQVSAVSVTAIVGAAVEYSTDNSTWSATAPSYTDVVDTTVYWRVTKDWYETDSGSVKVKITEASIKDFEIKANDAVTYDGEAHKSATVVVGIPADATITYSCGSDSYNDIPSFTDAGTYEVSYVISKANYTDVVGSYQFTVKKADMTGVSITASAKAKYDGSVKVSAVAVIPEGAVVEYSWDNGDCTSADIPGFTGVGVYTVSYIVSKANYNDVVGSYEFEIEEGVTRLAGANRFDTAFASADALKDVMGVDKFPAAIVTSGMNFADALAGSYLAACTGAPILLTDNDNMADVIDYILENVEEGGVVYALGGTTIVSDTLRTVEDEGYTFKRLAGASRFETNLLILEEAGIESGDPVLVCTAYNFADSLSASALGLPILLVDDTVSAAQMAFLEENADGEFVLIGGTGAVKPAVEEQLREKWDVVRLAGGDRFETSVLTAIEAFGFNTDTAVLAYGYNFPDGLCAGPLAYALGAPLILTANGDQAAAVEYATAAGASSGFVLGGPSLIDDSVAKAIFSLGADDSIIWN